MCASIAERAVHLATHPEELAALRRELAENRATASLFNTARFVRHLEEAYRMMIESTHPNSRSSRAW